MNISDECFPQVNGVYLTDGKAPLEMVVYSGNRDVVNLIATDGFRFSLTRNDLEAIMGFLDRSMSMWD